MGRHSTTPDTALSEPSNRLAAHFKEHLPALMLNVNALQRPSAMQRDAHSSGDADATLARSLPGKSVPGYILGPACCANSGEQKSLIATSAPAARSMLMPVAGMVQFPSCSCSARGQWS